jgi:lipopolysaccharide export system permease protein
MFDFVLTRLNFYFCRIFLLWFGASTAVVTFILVLADLADISRRSMSLTKIRFNHVLELIALKIPYHIQMLLPFIVLVTAILTLSRLNRSNETLVARGFGVSIWQLATGLSIVVVLLSAFYLTVLNPLSAVFNEKSEALDSRLFKGKDISLSLFDNGLWLRENYMDRHSIVSISRINPNTRVFKDLIFQNFTSDFDFQTRIDAKHGMLLEGKWVLQDVEIYHVKQPKIDLPLLEISTDMTFDKILHSNLDPKFISFWKLPDYIMLLENSGLSSLSHRMYWHSLLAKVGFMISLVYLAAAFTQRPRRQGYTTFLIGAALATGLLLHTFSDFIYAYGQGGKLPVLLAAWAPTIVVMLLSITLILHLEEG